MQTVVVYGNSPTTTATIAALMHLDDGLVVTVPDDSNGALFNDLVALGGMGHNTLAKATPKVVAEADLLVFTDTLPADADADDANALTAANIKMVREALNGAMANGFTGTLLVATTRDELLTYFAQRFSGVASDHVLGVGTAAHSLFTANRIAQELNVPVHNVAVDVVGTATDYQVLWSRAAVSTVPLLSMVQNDAAKVSAEIIQTVNRELQQFAAGIGAAVTADVVARIAAVLLSTQTDIVPLTLIDGTGAGLTVVARPAVVGRQHVQVLPRVAGAQAEEEALKEITDRVLAAIHDIEHQSNGSK
ncbi:hypothetical protein [Lacticaseibacillus thailandensis]|uniref:Lactate/malate dehydrogenase C-terminal domain-containing protein n=1 Tax=Lacticaseibacillus thailandensis DSM 22698 = JCM 13996 TaxID=1423810 RepID=A0A0R2C9F3_9LACO|nr:hypothetical protein [Lacticaseibacillus thailandensis]KRM88000.1 hypothetical protein FD19_GL000283 [Lacticaseibacillus thailandensis DSM 22698 = JCM 13996]